MGTSLLSLSGAYDKEFQRLLLYHLLYCEDLLKLALPVVKPSDFEMATQRLVYEALQDYYQSYRQLPTRETLHLHIFKVIQNPEKKYTSVIMPEEFDAMGGLIAFLGQRIPLSEERFRAELGPYLKWIRGSRLVAQYQASHGNMAELTQKLNEIERQVIVLEGGGVQRRLSQCHGLILTEQEAPLCVSTGLTRLDCALDGGIRKNELGMFTACPGVGKTNTLIHMAVIATLFGWRVLYITLELEHAKISRRVIAMSAGIPGHYTKVPVTTWPPEYKRRMEMYLDPAFGAYDRLTIADLSGKICPVQRMDKEIELWLATQQKEFGSTAECALVCVDWADKWVFPGLGKDTPEHLRLTKVMEEMDRISHRYPVGVWTATQGTKEADGHAFLTMSSVSGSFHKNDSLDIGVGIGIHPDDQIKVRGALSKSASSETPDKTTAELNLIFTINKSREGQLLAVNVYRAETLRLYDNPTYYHQHMTNITHSDSPTLLWKTSKQSVSAKSTTAG